MQLSDVEEVKQVSFSEALADGWKLVTVTQGTGGPVYVLGRTMSKSLDDTTRQALAKLSAVVQSDTGQSAKVVSFSEVNKALADGWKLVAVTQGTGGPVYVLGRTNFTVLQKAVAAAQGKVLRPVEE